MTKCHFLIDLIKFSKSINPTDEKYLTLLLKAITVGTELTEKASAIFLLLSILIFRISQDGYFDEKLSKTVSNFLQGRHHGVLKTTSTFSDDSKISFTVSSL